ncbi:MAG: hypothetical protein LQ345_007411 [Seirophora villosa]|nr:MAG: hypothetical protein LQ345_007411 [Seirophora villosa]
MSLDVGVTGVMIPFPEARYMRNEVPAKGFKHINGAVDGLTRRRDGRSEGIGQDVSDQRQGGVPLPLEGFMPATQCVSLLQHLVHNLGNGDRMVQACICMFMSTLQAGAGVGYSGKGNEWSMEIHRQIMIQQLQQ